MPVDNYLVFYISDKNAGVVTVIRVMYVGRDVGSQLNEHTEAHKFVREGEEERKL